MSEQKPDFWKVGTIALGICIIVAIPTALILRSRYPTEVFQGLIGLIALAILCLVSFVIYFIPSIVAYSGNRSRFIPIFVLNFFLGFTYVGWVIALVLALWIPEKFIKTNTP